MPQFSHITVREKGSKSSGYLLNDAVKRRPQGQTWGDPTLDCELLSTMLYDVFLQHQTDSDLYVKSSTSSKVLIWNEDFRKEYQKSYIPKILFKDIGDILGQWAIKGE